MILDDLAGYLATQGLGTVGTDIFKGRLPDTVASALAIFSYAGSPPEFSHDSPQPALRYPRLQVLVRAPTYAAASAKAEAAYTALCQIVNTTIDGTLYLRVQPLSEPLAMPRDPSGRAEIATNYEAIY